MTLELPDPWAPVRWLPHDDRSTPADGIGLCLSGGGYRAMLFHVGVLRRLHEAGWLGKLTRVSSVSGGSITAAVLALAWPHLHGASADPAAFVDRVETPLRRMASTHVDLPAILEGLAIPWRSIGDRVTARYREVLFGDATLADLPDAPVFVINSTNVASGALFRFAKAYAADWLVGRIRTPDIPLAAAVAASSAFPPFLSPYYLDLSHQTWTTDSGNTLIGTGYRSTLRLSDGGVYDNIGVETVWKRCRSVIVSDAGGKFSPDPDPAGDWARHTLRVLDIIDHQVRSLRKRQIIDGLQAGPGAAGRDGVYIGSRSHVADFPVPGAVLPADPAVTEPIADIPTRLDALDDTQQKLLINWGYVIADAGLRAHLDPVQPVGTLPHPGQPLTVTTPAPVAP